MTSKELAQRLEKIGPTDAEGLRRLQGDLDLAVRDAPRAVVDVWLNTQDAAQASMPGFVAYTLGDLTMAALLDSATKASGARLAECLTAVVTAMLAVRARIFDTFERLLNDPAPASRPADEASRGTRTCDRAYVIVRRMLPGADAGPGAKLDEAAFLGQGSTERDEEIRKWKRSKTWKALRDREDEP